MSEEVARLKRLVKEASGVLAATNGNVQIRAAMQFVGFTTPERHNMTLCQQVRRMLPKTTVTVALKTAPTEAAVSVAAVTNSGSTDLSSLTASGLSSDNLEATPDTDSDNASDSTTNH